MTQRRQNRRLAARQSDSFGLRDMAASAPRTERVRLTKQLVAAMLRQGHDPSARREDENSGDGFRCAKCEQTFVTTELVSPCAAERKTA